MTLDSQKLLESASAWIERNLDFFDPRNRAPEHQLAYLKAFDELCLLGILRCRMGNARYASDAVLEHCKDILSTTPIDQVFISNMEHFQLLAIPASLGRRFGLDNLGKLIFAHLPYLPLLSSERQQHRALDVGYCLRMLEVPADTWASSGMGDLARYEAGAAAASNLSYPPDPALNTLHDFYAFTHNIMFATDFGEVDVGRAFPALHRGRTRHTIETAILRFLCEKNLDIVAELVWCLQMLDMLSGPVAALGLLTISGAVRSHGYLPGPEVKHAGATETRHIGLHANYHATLLAIATLTSCDSDHLGKSLDAEVLGELRLESFYVIGKTLHDCAQAHPLCRPGLAENLNAMIRANAYFGHRQYPD